MAAIGGLLLVSGGLPAWSQEVVGELGGQDAIKVDPVEVNAGRFVAMGGVFGDMRLDCIRCHGLDGAGDGSGAFPRLNGQAGWYLYKTLNDFATGDRQSIVMSPIARTLTQEQMRQVAAYYNSLPNGPGLFVAEADPRLSQQGGAIAATGIAEQGVPACAGCHGANGEGMPPMTPYLASQSAAYLERQLTMWKEGRRTGDPLGVMAVIAQAMSAEQISAVAHYYAAVRPGGAAAAVPAVTAPESVAPAADQTAAPPVLPPYLAPEAAGAEPQKAGP